MFLDITATVENRDTTLDAVRQTVEAIDIPLTVGGGIRTTDDMQRLSDFEGVYGQARVGYAMADQSSGKLWLQNANGVVLALKAKRTGLALRIGADGVVVKFK